MLRVYESTVSCNAGWGCLTNPHSRFNPCITEHTSHCLPDAYFVATSFVFCKVIKLVAIVWWETDFKMMTTNILRNDPVTNTMIDSKTDSMTDRRHDLPPDQDQDHGYDHDQKTNMFIAVSYSCNVFFSLSAASFQLNVQCCFDAYSGRISGPAWGASYGNIRETW